MAMNEGQVKPNKMTVHLKANDLCLYTLKICANEKIFKPEFRGITADLVETAKNIFIDAWAANDIRVECADDFKLRHSLQKRAVWNCDRLLALMQISQRVFHLKYKRIKYWGGMTREVKLMLKAWRDSDSKRYANFK